MKCSHHNCGRKIKFGREVWGIGRDTYCSEICRQANKPLEKTPLNHYPDKCEYCIISLQDRNHVWRDQNTGKFYCCSEHMMLGKEADVKRSKATGESHEKE